MPDHRQPGFLTGISLLLPITLSVMAIVLLAPILPLLLAEFSAIPGHEYWVPMILTVPALCVAVFSPIAGVLGDAFGRRRLLIVALAAYAVLGVLPVFLSDFSAILASRVGVGITEAMIMVLTTTLIGDYFTGEQRDKWLAAQTAFASLSALVFFNVGGLLGQFGWRTPFWVYGSALLMLALVLAFTWEPRRSDRAQAEQPPGSTSWAGFPWARMAVIIAMSVFGSVLFYTVQIQAPNALTVLGWTDPAQTGFWTSVASIGVPLGTFVFSRVVDWPVRRLLGVEFALLACGFAVMGTAATPQQFLAGCFINQLGAGMLLPTLLVWAMSILPFAIRSRGAGMWTGAFSLGQFISPIVVTFFAAQAGGLIAAFALMGVLAALGLVAALLGNFQRGEQPVEGAASHG